MRTSTSPPRSIATRFLEAGLILKVRVAVAGEILVELLRVAKETLIEHTEEAKNVAAVLTAAGYEGLVRRMGEEFAGVTGRPKLDAVIGELKGADVFKGGQVGIANSYLKFRNDSLHADWKRIDRSQVESCLAFCVRLPTSDRCDLFNACAIGSPHQIQYRCSFGDPANLGPMRSAAH